MAAGNGTGRPELTSEARALLAPRSPLGLPMPAFDGRSLPNLAVSVVHALGGRPSEAALGPLAPEADPFGGRRADGPVLLLVVDGLGYTRLVRRSHAPGGGFAAAWLARGRPLSSVFPTSTTVALASLATGAPPSRHGIVGYRQFLPRFGAVVDVLRMSPHGVGPDETLVGPAWAPETVLGAPTIYRHGVPGAVAVSRERFEGRAFTRMIYDGAQYVPYAAWADLAAALADQLGRATPPPLTVGYWDELDTVEHLRGPGSAAVDLELDRLAELLAYVARAVGPRAARATTVLVTADHGVVPVDPAVQVALDAEPTIAVRLARPPTGDRRAALLKARPGQVEALERALADRLPPGARVVRSEEAVRAGLFGPPPFHPDLAEAVADVLALVPSPSGMTYAVPGRPPLRRALRGAHGGLEPDELLVPLIAGTLAELADRGT